MRHPFSGVDDNIRILEIGQYFFKFELNCIVPFCLKRQQTILMTQKL